MNWFPEDLPVRSRFYDTWKIPLHVAEKGAGADQTVLFLHGNPTWSYLYRNLLGPVSRDGFHVMAPDLPGFGRSGKWVQPASYTFDRHVEAAGHVLEHGASDNVVLVGHDWGGPIGLQLAFNYRERIAGVILINSGTFFDLDLPFVFRLLTAPGIGELVLGRCNGFVEAGLRAGCAQKQKLRPGVMRHYRRPFRKPDHRAGIVAFPRMIPSHERHDNWKRFRRLERRASEFTAPVGIISGRRDPVFGPDYGDRMDALFPRSFHRIIERGSHYLHEDQPEQLLKAIRGFLDIVYR